MGTVKMKMSGAAYEAIREDIQKYAPRQTMILARAKRVQSGCSEIYLVPRIILLDEREAVRSLGRVEAGEEHLLWLEGVVHEAAGCNGFRVVAMHSHPFQEEARFTSADWSRMRERKMCGPCFDGCEFIWIVFNGSADSFDGFAVRESGEQEIDQIFVHGERLKVLNGARHMEFRSVQRQVYSRFLLIPEWEQEFISNLRVAIVGLGGLGSAVLEAVMMLGLGDDSDLVLIDPGITETSNWSRILYASPLDIGRSKVSVAQNYVGRLRAGRRVLGIEEPCYSAEAQKALSGCDIAFGCVDNDLGRACLNYVAGSFMVMLLDMESCVLSDRFEGQRFTVSSGQIRLFIPGSTACLLCNMGLNRTDFDKGLLTVKLDLSRKGLLRVMDYLPIFTKGCLDRSAHVLNASVANAGVALMTRYLLGGPLDFHGLRYTLETMKWEYVRAESSPVCPVCGNEGLIGRGDFFDIEAAVPEEKPPMAKPKEE